jgi:hypothetical protein
MLSQLLKYFWPSNLFAGFSFIFSEWHRSDARERAILLLIFAPMIACVLGLLYSFASFVFEAISKLLGWFLLSALFGGGGIFCYEKLRESRSTSFSSAFSSASRAGSSARGAASTAENSEKTAQEGNGVKESGRRKWF